MKVVGKGLMLAGRCWLLRARRIDQGVNVGVIITTDIDVGVVINKDIECLLFAFLVVALDLLVVDREVNADVRALCASCSSGTAHTS